ncbi:MAG: YcgN family cysteine cluster protein [Gammaproteobacteria bacterium]|nr:YcgN family cysteine cluster protein [Gammaproteobacteria bacterium]
MKLVGQQKTKSFWQEKKLTEFTPEEWESLCDGCAQCCLHKLEDEDSGDLYFTNVACRFLDHETCRCSCYEDRSVIVPDCLQVTPQLAMEANWLPATCAYRLLAVGEDLPEWHPLLSGSVQSVFDAGASIRGRAISEEYIHPDDLPNYIVDADDDVELVLLE